MLSPKQVEKIKKNLDNYPVDPVRVFHALGDPCRFNMFLSLMQEGKMCVSDVSKVCDISVSAASQQFKNLELCGVVLRQRKGQTTCYQLNLQLPLVRAIAKLLKKGL